MSPPQTASQGATQSLPAGTHLEEFIIERVLGVGGFGITYLAKDSSLGRQVVIKENLPAQFCWRDTHALTVRPRHTEGEDADNFSYSLESFRKEAATLASLDHPGIVKVLRSFQAHGTAYFVMPFVEGTALDEVIRQRTSQGNPFTEAEIQDLLTKVLEALGYMHERGIYHRDIKPGNILMTKVGPVLIDFGAARQRLSERSLTVIESPGYTPFEQLQSRGKIGPWSDLYALGTTLYKAITGQTPAKATDRAFDDPEVPLTQRDELRERYSPVLLGSIDKAMSPKASDRFQDADEWRQWVEGDPVTIVQKTETQTTPTVLQEPPLAPLPAAQDSGRVSLHEEHRCILAGATDAMLRNDASTAAHLFKQLQNKRFSDLDYRQVEKYVSQKKLRIGRLFVIAFVIYALLVIVGMITTYPTKDQEASNSVPIERIGHEQADIQEKQEQTAGKDERDQLLKEAEMQRKEAANDFNSASLGDTREVDLGGGVKMTFCYVPAGSFTMGSPASEAYHLNDEDEVQVKISRGFWLAQTECTQAQWRAVMGTVPSSFKGDNLPVESVSWEESKQFMGKLNGKNVLPTGWKWSLPTEAQWEYACRAGTTAAFSAYMDSMAWYAENSDRKTHTVRSKAANDWDLSDMHGNVSEWCNDWYAEKYVRGTDPIGASSGSLRVNRGGSWTASWQTCRSAYRHGNDPGSRYYYVGFRAASVPMGQ